MTAFRAIGFLVIALSVAIGLTGCVSHSARTYYGLDITAPEFQTLECKRAIKAVGYQEDLRLARAATGPALVLLTGGLALLPYTAGYIALEAFDIGQAREIEKKCVVGKTTPHFEE
jgi:hypothetical protein